MPKEKLKFEKIMTPSVEDIPGIAASAAFVVKAQDVFREDGDVTPEKLDKKHSYMPWGRDNGLPYRILDLVESDETMATCLLWNAQMCYGNGLQYNTEDCKDKTKNEVKEWLLDNQLPAFFLGTAQDLKHWAFAVSVIILSKDRKHIARLIRKESCYCRFSEKDSMGKIRYVYYGPWRNKVMDKKEVEVIPVLDETAPWRDLCERAQSEKQTFKFAVVTRVPTADHTYYPIPYWAALFRSRWYNIKQLIAMAKEAKIKNAAPIKYLVEISDKYFERLFIEEGITDAKKKRERVVKAKRDILDFLTGAENSGKTWFSTFYNAPDGHQYHDVVINKIDTAKEGGDWESDIQEAVNMICFTMQVHTNLVGSVPGKSQSNNSGSDKRELYTIAQAIQKPYHDLLFTVHHIICRFNGWDDVKVEVPFIQLTTLDENKDAKKVTMDAEPASGK